MIDGLARTTLPVCSVAASLPAHLAADKPGTTLWPGQTVESFLGRALALVDVELGF